MVLPFEPLNISFLHLWYSVDLPSGMNAPSEASKDGGEPRLYLLKVQFASLLCSIPARPAVLPELRTLPVRLCSAAAAFCNR